MFWRQIEKRVGFFSLRGEVLSACLSRHSVDKN